MVTVSRQACGQSKFYCRWTYVVSISFCFICTIWWETSVFFFLDAPYPGTIPTQGVTFSSEIYCLIFGVEDIFAKQPYKRYGHNCGIFLNYIIKTRLWGWAVEFYNIVFHTEMKVNLQIINRAGNVVVGGNKTWIYCSYLKKLNYFIWLYHLKKTKKR